MLFGVWALWFGLVAVACCCALLVVWVIDALLLISLANFVDMVTGNVVYLCCFGDC